MECTIVLPLLALIAIIHDVYGINTSKNMNILNGQAGQVDCFDAYENCRKIPGCQAALRMLNKKCKIHRGKCSPDSDVKVCADVRDQLYMYGFPKERCRCEKSLFRCFKLLNKIYANPCFEEHQSAQKQTKDNRAPSKHDMVETSTSAEKEIETTISLDHENKTLESHPIGEDGPSMESGLTNTEADSESSITASAAKPWEESRKKPRETKHRLRIKPTEEIIFGDDGFAEPRLPSLFSRRKNKPERLASDDSNKISYLYEETEMFEAAMSEWTTEAVPNEESTTQPKRQVHYLPKQEVEWEMTTDMKYRLISIGIGSVFVLIILVTMLYFAWIRISKLPFRYKHGKVVTNNNQTGA